VIEAVKSYPEQNAGSPARSTIADTCFSFDNVSPANDEIFQTRFCQLMNKLETMESYNPILLNTQNLHPQGVDLNACHQAFGELRSENYAAPNPYVNQEDGRIMALPEENVCSEVNVPYERLDLDNLARHYQASLRPVSIKKKCEKRGRKRVNVLPAKNFAELLHNIVLPKWTSILASKTQREGEPLGQVTEEYVWIKVLRDMRDFYRIIFKSRFHRSEKREDSNRDVLVKIFLEELGITDITHMNSVATFDFLYKAHYKARNKDEGKLFKDTINSTPMRIYYYYSETAKNNF
jgi:hypothetical protein